MDDKDLGDTQPIQIPPRPPLPTWDASKLSAGRITAENIKVDSAKYHEALQESAWTPETLDAFAARAHGYHWNGERYEKTRNKNWLIWTLAIILALVLIGGAIFTIRALQTIQERDVAISQLRGNIADKNMEISDLQTTLTDTQDTLGRSQDYAARCEAQAEAYWLSAVALGDAFVAYIDLFPYGTLDISEAEEYRDEGDIQDCYTR